MIWDIIPTKGKVAEIIGSNNGEAWDLIGSLCGTCKETIHHLVLSYTFSRAIWSESPWQLNILAF